MTGGAIQTTENDIKERLSVGYLTTVAARAGCQVLHVHVDRNSIDAVVKPIAGAAVQLDIQLKATCELEPRDNSFIYDLPMKNYDDLRNTEVEHAQILVVLDLPKEAAKWITCDEEALLLRRCAYWVNLYGQPHRENVATVRVQIPRANSFTPEALRSLMERRLVMLREGRGGLSE
jgi:hypothetical protein